MKLLLDTHILVWWVAGDRKLPKSLRDRIIEAQNEVWVSAATFWELSIKLRLGRIDIDLEELRTATIADGFSELSVKISHTLRLPTLPDHHKDPFDRMLITQSIVDGLQLVTRDEAILAYTGLKGFDPLSS